MLQVKRMAWALTALILASCVTINIYFPEAAAEEAARTIVRDVLGKEAAPSPVKKKDKQSNAIEGMLDVASVVLGSFVGQAHAAQAPANIDISSPAISSLRAAMAKRQSQLGAFYQSGAVGFDRNAGVAIRDLGAVALRDRGRVKKLVADENADRDALYREIARANGHPEWKADVRAIFARVWVEEARAGTWYQTAQGAWQQR